MPPPRPSRRSSRGSTATPPAPGRRVSREFQRRTLPAHELERATDQARWFGLCTGVFFVALWLVVARLCASGRSSGRTCATVLAVVYTFTFVLSGVRSFGPGAVIGVLTMCSASPPCTCCGVAR